MRQQPVYFILPPLTLLLDVAGPAEALMMANRFQNDVEFDLHFFSPDLRVDSSIGLALSKISRLPRTIPPNAMIVVSGAAESNDPEIAKSRLKIVNWLRELDSNGKRLVFICSGALLAAKAGLLDGRSCTTHHTDCDELRALAPDAVVLDNRIYVVDDNIYTSAGVTAGVDLTLQLIAEIAGPVCAAATARNLVVYLRRTASDTQLSPWLDHRNHIHPAVHRVQDAISADPSHPWTLIKLARLANSSPRHLARLFHLHTKTTPLAYLNRLRIELARQLLTDPDLPLEIVAERSGFGSERHMRRIWRKFIPTPPAHWRRQHDSLS